MKVNHAGAECAFLIRDEYCRKETPAVWKNSLRLFKRFSLKRESRNCMEDIHASLRRPSQIFLCLRKSFFHEYRVETEILYLLQIASTVRDLVK